MTTLKKSDSFTSPAATACMTVAVVWEPVLPHISVITGIIGTNTAVEIPAV
nr:hypothetical protein [Candidatus Mycoplasma haematobovis]